LHQPFGQSFHVYFAASAGAGVVFILSAAFYAGRGLLNDSVFDAHFFSRFLKFNSH
jgi:hypothetical protein